MQLQTLCEIREKLLQEKIILSFTGSLSQYILVDIISSLKHNIQTLQASSDKVHDILIIFIEIAQNILKYSEKTGNTLDTLIMEACTLIIGFDQKKEKFYVSSTNIIHVNKKEQLIQHLNHINKLSKEELNNYYRAQRKSGENKHFQGAGLGFLEMAKRSSEKIEYIFKPYMNDYEIFLLKVYA